MLFGERVRLRAIEREDIPALMRWMNDPEVRSGLLFHAPVGRADEERWLESHTGRTDDYVFAIEAPADVEDLWVHIGNVGLHHIDWKNRSALFGIMLGEKAYWDRGFGTDATRTMLRFAFDELNLHRVELGVFDYNERAVHVYEKVGFRLEGTRRHVLFHEGRFRDSHVMSVLEDEYRAL